ncbi:helix-turn-helix domain-containing protein [Actinomadura atramentaria]|uniref:helix-turn-helix domain-containing protein n=1 Tax=Actinomadura atramentaria TaxID=1990 RepID=UPI0003813719|nr:helix-turn-helix domain-containing protein [Actinomadura atramentaria]
MSAEPIEAALPGALHEDLALLDADDVCAILRIKKSWLYDQVEAGKIKVIRLGRQLRFRRADIAEFIESCTS